MVIPALKNGEKTNINNYRPTSILPVIKKNIEKVIYNQLINYFNKHNLPFPHQYGFRSNHSTEFAALELIDRTIMALDKGDTPVNIFIDLCKAFDTLDHDILLNGQCRPVSN